VTVQKKKGSQLVSSSFAVPLHAWTHVVGVYDGQFVRLFSNGQQVGQVAADGVIADVSGPLRIGNNRENQFFPGRLDEVQLFNRALPDFEVAQLSCIQNPPTLSVTPINPAAVDADVTVHYDVAYTDNNGGACQPGQLFFSLNGAPPGITVSSPQFFQTVTSGQTVHFPVDVTGSTDADPGTQQLPFQLFDNSPASPLSGQLSFSLKAPTGCFVSTGRELLMRDLSVVEDPLRTRSSGDPADARTGAWTFAKLMQQLAPTPAQAPAMVEQMLRTWLSDQTVNTFTIPQRSPMQQLVLDSWPRSSDGSLDLTRAPLRLNAIVNRLDLRDLSKAQAGEGRFVFGVLDPSGFPLQFTMILEYRLPASSTDEVVAWANQWHALAALPFPSEAYNAALQALTTRFTARNAEPGRVNGSALGRLRTNEIALSQIGRWELREFTLSPTTGMLVPSGVELTPDTSFLNESPLVADFVNQNEAAVLLEQHVVPATFEGVPFLGGASFNDLLAWRSSGIVNPEARFRFSLNTCNGCHGSEETGTAFLHIDNRFPGSMSPISGFMSGISIQDPVTGVARTLNDLGRRNADLKAVVCGGTASTLTTPLPSSSVARTAAVTPAQSRAAFLSKGIGRVH
ncbi:MAG: hypothetical protein JWN04_3163, partial [Myxococcaceae bacterium]|nr:hypothetical protein [Myxococcaceae bacterium]